MVAIIYTRISKEKKERRDHVSPDMQLQMCRDVARAHGIAECRVFHEVFSGRGSQLNRRVFMEAINSTEAGDLFIVYAIERFGRNVVAILECADLLNKRGAKFLSASEPELKDMSAGESRLILTIYAAYAEFEVNMLSEQTRSVSYAMTAGGEYTGGRVPLGHSVRVDRSGAVPKKKLVLDHPELPRILELARRGSLSFGNAAAAIRARCSLNVSASQVKRAMQSLRHRARVAALLTDLQQQQLPP